MLQQRVEATRQQVANNRRLAGQTMACRYQLRTVRGWQYKPRRKRGTTLKRLENYWEPGKAVHRFATTRSRHLQADVAISKRWRIVHVGHLWAVVVEEGCLWGQQRPPLSSDK
ncbi:hypothetical protein E2C01_053720 [Portunus trituberculatus]|uniref:Uncharacterized protein n=1 Tax=Portunus trituberculatus TaxID=210409 RepID=A0A5B7GT13_PORTR|nr:hypothetical protein [Portunus trituberculatus]